MIEHITSSLRSGHFKTDLAGTGPGIKKFAERLAATASMTPQLLAACDRVFAKAGR
jgi:hypothetical protein